MYIRKYVQATNTAAGDNGHTRIPLRGRPKTGKTEISTHRLKTGHEPQEGFDTKRGLATVNRDVALTLTRPGLKGLVQKIFINF
jgi:hypothetical protein